MPFSAQRAALVALARQRAILAHDRPQRLYQDGYATPQNPGAQVYQRHQAVRELWYGVREQWREYAHVEWRCLAAAQRQDRPAQSDRPCLLLAFPLPPREGRGDRPRLLGSESIDYPGDACNTDVGWSAGVSACGGSVLP